MTSSCRTMQQSLQQYGRGVAGGLISSLPLLFTMEMWWAGFIAHPARLLVGLLGTFVLLLAYNRYAGLRDDASLTEVAIDSVEELGIGLVLSAGVLFLLGRIHANMPANEIIGQIVIEAMTVAIGVSVGTAQLGGGGDEKCGMEGEEQPSFFGQISIAFCGAILFAFNVAPTEEIVVFGVENEPWHFLATALVSLILGALILHFSEFRGAQRFVRHEGWFQVTGHIAVTYVVALCAAAILLWFFGRFEDNSFAVNLSQTVILGLPANLGASAGRLLLQGNESQ